MYRLYYIGSPLIDILRQITTNKVSSKPFDVVNYILICRAVTVCLICHYIQFQHQSIQDICPSRSSDPIYGWPVITSLLSADIVAGIAVQGYGTQNLMGTQDLIGSSYTEPPMIYRTTILGYTGPSLVHGPLRGYSTSLSTQDLFGCMDLQGDTVLPWVHRTFLGAWTFKGTQDLLGYTGPSRGHSTSLGTQDLPRYTGPSWVHRTFKGKQYFLGYTGLGFISFF